MKLQFLYENYHLNRNFQKRIIDDRDFTYRTLIGLLKKYSFRKMKILDIGCGVGTIDFYLATRGNTILGIDISRNGISVARRSLSMLDLENKIRFEISDFSKSKIEGKFDLIICSEVLEHMKDDISVVLKIRKLLKKNGIVIASSPSSNAPLYKLGLLKNFDLEVGHLRRYTERGFINLFEMSGLKILERKKTEGFLRNFLFTNYVGGLMLRILKRWPLSGIISFIDDRMAQIFGESNIYIVARKK